MKKLSVVVPIYNVEKYLRKCVTSILNQSYKYIDIILVDDGSDDSSSLIADEYGDKYENITVIHKKNGGLSDARNAGLEMVKTQYVTFVDSDDYIDSNMYESLMEAFDDDVDISMGSVWYEEESGKKVCPYKMGKKFYLSKEEALLELLSFRYFNMSFCDKIFKTELFTKNKYGDNGLRFPYGKKSEDQHLMCKVIARANRIYYDATPYYHYVQRQGSISRNNNVNIDSLEAVTEQLTFYEKWFPNLSYAAESAFLFNYMSVCSAFERKGVECPRDIHRIAKEAKKKYIYSVLKFRNILFKKKLQAITFFISEKVYYYIVNK